MYTKQMPILIYWQEMSTESESFNIVAFDVEIDHTIEISYL